MKGRLLLDIVIREGSAVLELLPGEDESLLVRGNALLVLDLRLDVVNRVGRLNLEGDRLSSQAMIREGEHVSEEGKSDDA